MLKHTMLKQKYAQTEPCSSRNVLKCKLAQDAQCKSKVYCVHAHGLLDHTAQVSQLAQVSVVWGPRVRVVGGGQQAMGI